MNILQLGRTRVCLQDFEVMVKISRTKVQGQNDPTKHRSHVKLLSPEITELPFIVSDQWPHQNFQDDSYIFKIGQNNPTVQRSG